MGEEGEDGALAFFRDREGGDRRSRGWGEGVGKTKNKGFRAECFRGGDEREEMSGYWLGICNGNWRTDFKGVGMEYVCRWINRRSHRTMKERDDNYSLYPNYLKLIRRILEVLPDAMCKLRNSDYVTHSKAETHPQIKQEIYCLQRTSEWKAGSSTPAFFLEPWSGVIIMTAKKRPEGDRKV